MLHNFVHVVLAGVIAFTPLSPLATHTQELNSAAVETLFNTDIQQLLDTRVAQALNDIPEHDNTTATIERAIFNAVADVSMDNYDSSFNFTNYAQQLAQTHT